VCIGCFNGDFGKEIYEISLFIGERVSASTDGIVQYAPSQTWFLLYLKSMTAGWQVSFTFTSLD